MPRIFIKNYNREIHYSEGKSLLDILVENDVFIDNPCNGKGVCGKCKIKLLEGEGYGLSETEKKFLKEDEINSGIRLSCFLAPNSDIEVELLQSEKKHEILTTGYIPEFKYDPSITKKVFNIKKPSLDNQTPFEDSLLNTLKCSYLDLDILKNNKAIYGDVTGIFSDKTLIGIEEGDTREILYGVAVDIGTTTVVTALIDMNTGEEITTESMINAQKKFGLDVLTRITYEIENPSDAKKELQLAIVESINNMIENMCLRCNVDKNNIYEISISANCTMMHFLLGIDAVSIGKSPYVPVFTKAKNISARDIGLSIYKGARLYCLPSVSSYIGADIVAGAYVCELHKTAENILFIDIGTNGEIVLSNKGSLLSCSCAAGPALEGMNITSGMRASEGAIEDVKITVDGIKLQVIGDKKPIGVCGSGILAAVKELIQVGLIKKQGAFIKKEKLDKSDYRYDMIQMNGSKREFILCDKPEKLLITQGDVRQVQLAKGAILSGFYALLKKAGINMNDLNKVIIAGQFGAHLPVDSLVGIGILPEEVRDKLFYAGNSSKIGAYMALMSKDVKSEIEVLAGKIDYMELGASEGYERLFSECLIFPN